MRELNSLHQSLIRISEALAPGKTLLHQKEQLNSLSLVFEDIKIKFKNVGTPPEALAIKAAARYLAGDLDLDEGDIDLIAFALTKPLDSSPSNTLFNNESRLKDLLANYSVKCAAGRDMLITWRGVMGTYFEVSPAHSPGRAQFERSLEDIRQFLLSSWSSVKNSTDLQLSWMSAIEENKELLGENPCEQFAKQWFDGHEGLVLKISTDLQVSSISWFWERLFITCLQSILNFDESTFKKSIPKLLTLFDKHKLYRDRGLSALLDRYTFCSDISVNIELKEYALDQWASPEGHELAGSKWKYVSKPALTMFLNWVHETNLRLFFELLKERGYADEERLNFWLKFIPQVKSSRLSLGSTSQRIVESRSDLKKVFKRDGNTYSQLRDDQNPDNDAFLMTIGDCLIVDFSIGGGCYVYRQGQNTFDIKDKFHYSSTSRKGLKEKYKTKGMDFAHTPGWTDNHRAPTKLRDQYGITPTNVRILGGSDTYQQHINVRDYFNGLESKTRDSVGEKETISATYFEAKASATKLATINGIECGMQGKYYVVKLLRDKGPLASRFEALGFTFKNGIGWTLQ